MENSDVGVAGIDQGKGVGVAGADYYIPEVGAGGAHRELRLDANATQGHGGRGVRGIAD